MKLYDYYRSSSSYRVRIALHYKGLSFETEHVDLVAGEQREVPYTVLNPSAGVPTLIDGDVTLSQSPAILEYLEEAYPKNPLLPDDINMRGYIRQMMMIVATDIHPLNNLKVWKGYLGKTLGVDEDQQMQWYRHWIAQGFDAYEHFLRREGHMGAFTYGDTPSLADCCLIPQIYNARRFGFDMTLYPLICDIERHCMALPAYQHAAPESHPYAPEGLEIIHGPNAPILAPAA